MKETRTCELCVDCEDTICCGKQCHKNIDSCVITEDCFSSCENGFIGIIPIFDLPDTRDVPGITNHSTNETGGSESGMA